MEKREIKDELFYSEKVETTFRTLDKALLECMSTVTNCLLVSCGFNSEETPKCLNLLNFLNSQHLSCQSFVKNYGKMTEEV